MKNVINYCREDSSKFPHSPYFATAEGNRTEGLVLPVQTLANSISPYQHVYVANANAHSLPIRPFFQLRVRASHEALMVCAPGHFYIQWNPKNFGAFSKSSISKNKSQKISLNELFKFKLKKPLEIIIERDGPGYIAKYEKIPLYGYDKTKKGALEKLKREFEELFSELEEDQNYTSEWKAIHEFLKGTLMENESPQH